MKSLFRSEKMQHCEMILHAESAFECLIQLGYMGAVQFINQPGTEDETQNRYQREIQRCNEILRMLNQMEHESHAAGMRNFYYPEVDLEDVPQIKDMSDIETKIRRLNDDLLEIDRNTFGLKRREMALKEEYYVLNHVEDMLRGQHNTERIMAWSDSVIMNLIKDETAANELRSNEQKLRFYAGTIPVERFASFETMLFRVCHHNFYIQKENIPEAIEDVQGVPKRKYVFMVAFVGERVGQLINKVCQGFRVRSINVSESSAERNAKMEDIQTDLNNFKQIYDRTQFERNQILAVSGGDVFVWKVKLLKMLAIYTELNEMSVFDGLDSQKYLKASCWVPEKDIKRVRKALLRGARRAARGDMSMMFPPSLVERSNRLIDHNPPTSINLNRFTRAFQKLIDAYGLPAYQELNPAPYTVITFPFLFAVMFGDMGHGLIMFLFAAWMVKNELEFEAVKKKTKKSNEIWDILFAGRYIILLMGLFSMYTGLIYNDVFSLSTNFFGSSWKISREKANSILQEAEKLKQQGNDEATVILNPASTTEYAGTPYIMGIDPIWHLADNNILYENSYKMKLSIILGVAHMVFGLALFAINCVYTRNAVDFYLIFIPQLTFLLCVFGYLVMLIIYKWWAFGGHYETPYNTACAPSVLITFINMLLFKEIPRASRGCEEEIFTGQEILQYFLVFLALISIPILLAGKPLHFMHKQRKIKKEQDERKRWGLRQETADAWRKSLLILEVHDSTIRDEEVENIDLTEMWIHSGIHTIECVLGAISHTASYLRLWALSLAHDQLSIVLWEFLIRGVFTAGGGGLLNAAFLIIVFYPWASLTIAIMIVMEGLSAFLHCLRLHWVEFQSKFYLGTGMAFKPFLFADASEVDLL